MILTKNKIEDYELISNEQTKVVLLILFQSPDGLKEISECLLHKRDKYDFDTSWRREQVSSNKCLEWEDRHK